MILREETFEQTEGLGVLELRGNGLELVLFLNGESLVYDAADCAGSVGRFTVFLPSEQNLAAQMQIETNSQVGFVANETLREQVAPLLVLLPNGAYRLVLEELINDETSYYEVLDWEYASQTQAGRVMGYYPEYGVDEPRTLITTQPQKALDESRVNFYVSEIKRGVRPALIALRAKQDDYISFILDGHHKLKAYAHCRATPRVLSIEFQTAPPVSLQLAQQTLKDVDYDDVPRYLREKRDREL